MNAERREKALRWAFRTFPNKMPSNGSVAAYIDWLLACDKRHHRKWLQSELHGEYQTMCILTGRKPVKEKHFGKHLTQAGYTPEQDDNRENGRRHRPMMVDLSRLPSLPLSLPSLPASKSKTATRDISGNRRARVEIETRIAA